MWSKATQTGSLSAGVLEACLVSGLGATTSINIGGRGFLSVKKAPFSEGKESEERRAYSRRGKKASNLEFNSRFELGTV